MMKKVYYIGWYIAEQDKANYYGNVPGNLKMNYVAKKIIEAGFFLHVISLANKNTSSLYKNKEYSNKRFSLTYLGGFSGKTKFARIINFLIKQILLVYFLIIKTNRNDTIIVYHSPSITSLVAWVNRVLKRKIICEVEEIYGYSAICDDDRTVKKEFDSIIKYDSFILINDYLHEELNIRSDNYCPCYGVVNIVPRTKSRIDDGFIHIVYAGTIEGRKQGAYQAVDAAEFLPKNYKLHILGFGKKEHIDLLKGRINEINIKQGYDMVVYDGFKSGDELDQYLYSCHIGISTYVMRESFANHSLPSKIFTYMCHDLAVVRGYASAYEGREIANNWTFYKKDSPKAIAEAVQKVIIPDLELNRSYLEKCDKRLVKFLKNKC